MTTILSRAEKEEAEALGLTLPERKAAKSMNVSAATYARHKAEISDAKEARVERDAVAAQTITERLQYAPRRGTVNTQEANTEE